MDSKELARRLYGQAKILSLGMGTAVFIYGGMAYYLIRMGKGGTAFLDPRMYQLVLYGLLTFSTAGIFLMRQIREKILNAGQNLKGASTAGATRHPQKLFLATVLLMAAAEMPVLFGLVLVFLGRNFYVFIPFGVLSITGFYMALPKKQFWEEWLGESF